LRLIILILIIPQRGVEQIDNTNASRRKEKSREFAPLRAVLN
jgi:hypothetical protein